MKIAIILAVLLCAPVIAATPALLLDHDVLLSMARTGAPGIAIEYTPDRVVFRTRHRAAVVWLDVRLEARFVRDGKRVHLAATRLTAAGMNQNASRFDEAAAKLARLVDVETAKDRVEIYQADKLVYSQLLAATDNRRAP